MSIGGSLVRGLIGGFETGQRIANVYDEERDEEREEQLLLEQLAENKRLAAKQEGRNDILFEQQQNDRIRQLARQEDLDAAAVAETERRTAMEERELALREMSAESRRRVEDATISNTMTQQQVAQLEMEQLQQHARAKEASGIAAQAQSLFEQGDIAGGMKMYQELDQFGMGVKDIMEGKYSAQEAEDVIGGLINGEKDLSSPEAKTLMKMLLRPSFITSGRDPERYEATGIRESRPGFYAIELTDKETGKLVPATDLRTSEGKDPITEVSEESLMQSATAWLSMARQVEAGKQAMDAQRQIAALQARLMSDRVSGSASRAQEPASTAMPENQQAFIDLQETESDRSLAAFLIAEEGYTPNIGDQMRRIKEIRREEGGSINDAIQAFRQEREIDGVLAARVTKLVNRGVDERKAERLERRLIEQRITREQYEREVQKLIEQANEPDQPPEPAKPTYRGNRTEFAQ